jgi:hypothetical protein
MVEYKDKYVITWNEDLIKLSNRAKRLANEILKAESNRNVSGIAEKDATTLTAICTLITDEIAAIKKGYFPATHDDIKFRALLADLSHPEPIEIHEEPSEAEPAPAPAKP